MLLYLIQLLVVKIPIPSTSSANQQSCLPSDTEQVAEGGQIFTLNFDELVSSLATPRSINNARINKDGKYFTEDFV